MPLPRRATRVKPNTDGKLRSLLRAKLAAHEGVSGAPNTPITTANSVFRMMSSRASLISGLLYGVHVVSVKSTGTIDHGAALPGIRSQTIDKNPFENPRRET